MQDGESAVVPSVNPDATRGATEPAPPQGVRFAATRPCPGAEPADRLRPSGPAEGTWGGSVGRCTAAKYSSQADDHHPMPPRDTTARAWTAPDDRPAASWGRRGRGFESRHPDTAQGPSPASGGGPCRIRNRREAAARVRRPPALPAAPELACRAWPTSLVPTSLVPTSLVPTSLVLTSEAPASSAWTSAARSSTPSTWPGRVSVVSTSAGS